MGLRDPIECRDDIEAVLRAVFPFEAERFALFLPCDEEARKRGESRLGIEETAEAFILVVESIVYEADADSEGNRRIESIRQQEVRLLSRAALPIRLDRFANYLQAIERVVAARDFESLQRLPPSRWFNADLLDLPHLASVEDFDRLLEASLPALADDGAGAILVAEVLLREPRFPTAEALREAWGGALPELPGRDGILAFELEGEAEVFVTSVPGPVPAVSTEAPWSAARFYGAPPVEPHAAHLLVTLTCDAGTPIDRFTKLVRFVAGAVIAADAVGVRVGDVAHPARYFLEQAREGSMMRLLCGVEVDLHGRRHIQSRGMDQLGLPELLVKTKEPVDTDALGLLFDLLEYVARRGEPLPPGHTIGRDDSERLRVRYESSPFDASLPVWSVEVS